MMPGRFPRRCCCWRRALRIYAADTAMAADADAAVPSDVVAEHYAAQSKPIGVYPDIGRRHAAALRAGIAAGRYALAGAALAEALGVTVQGVSPDGHLREAARERGCGARNARRAAPEKTRDRTAWLDRAGYRLHPLQRLSRTTRRSRRRRRSSWPITPTPRRSSST